jgi:Tol biopolymer transport system component
VRIAIVLALLLAGSAAAATPFRLAAISPDGRTRFYWNNPWESGSIQQDGLPLVAQEGKAQRVLVPWMLSWPDYLSWCGDDRVAVAGGDRYATHAKRLVVSAAPYRRTRALSHDPRLSWVDPACSPDGTAVVASAGRNFVEARFGQERRSLWLLFLDGRRPRRLTRPPAGRSDEAACWSADGATVYFVRSGQTSADARATGRLYALRVGDHHLRALEHLAPVDNVYGHYAWPQPATPRCGG